MVLLNNNVNISRYKDVDGKHKQNLEKSYKTK